ncbi:hypothetical protein K239x_24790 [Planctomycetes bacterium K23_9]|uniref:Uncharacterized protein n=1 Tax=Stieleria marina TaxID=1930275 RepID=A0A517NTT9_9BACT|nr:hypothetical protein K239x_24790 [Planctomycetes bacterium K23_9]
MGVLSGPQRSPGHSGARSPRDIIVTARTNRRKVIRAPTEQHPPWPLRLRASAFQSTEHRPHDRPRIDRASTACRPRIQTAAIKRIRAPRENDASPRNATHHRVGTVDVPFEKARKPAFGACDGYPPFGMVGGSACIMLLSGRCEITCHGKLDWRHFRRRVHRNGLLRSPHAQK